MAFSPPSRPSCVRIVRNAAHSFTVVNAVAWVLTSQELYRWSGDLNIGDLVGLGYSADDFSVVPPRLCNNGSAADRRKACLFGRARGDCPAEMTLGIDIL